MVANVKEAKLDSLNVKSSKVRIVMLASLVVSLLYLTGCCNQQQQGQAADGGRRDTKGIVAADKPDELPAQPQVDAANAEGQTEANPVGDEAGAEAGGEEAKTEDPKAEDDKNGGADKTDDVVNNMPGNVNPAGAGLNPGEGTTNDNSDDSDRVQPTEGEDTPQLDKQKEEVVPVSTEEL